MVLSDDRRPIVLASNSPRRAALLREAGVAFEVCVPKLEEPGFEGWRFGPAEFAQSASYYKARSVGSEQPDRVILAADTVVAIGNRIFGKPADIDDARRILSTLAGTTQDVITGVTLLEPMLGRRLIRHDTTRVTMRPMAPDELDAYLASGEWEGKAGAYGIQDSADAFIERVDGSFSNVVGLPVEMVLEMLKQFGALVPR